MRIQHNIMAMSAYRNYTNNVSAMKQNLEKLSSGYKINRAGDDAAGLAISEKMRAQITGLQTAQKNAKDGISLVQTAEGALTEVHDMLNRMVELASMSANGTYDNETDRAQLQKEMDQLLSEINRIADSSNFNGMKLLDGSMDASAIRGVVYENATTDDILGLIPNTDTAQDQPTTVDSDLTVTETEGTKASKAGFQISLDGINITANDTDKHFNLTIGDKQMTVELDAGTYTSSQLASKLADAYKTSGIDMTGSNGETANFKVTAEGNTLKFTSDDPISMIENADVSWELSDTTAADPYSISMHAGGISPQADAGSIAGTATPIEIVAAVEDDPETTETDESAPAVTATAAAKANLAGVFDGLEAEDGDVKVTYAAGQGAGSGTWTISVGDKSVAATATVADGVLSLKATVGEESVEVMTITASDTEDPGATIQAFEAAFQGGKTTGLTYTAPTSDPDPDEELATDVASNEIGDSLGIDWTDKSADIGSNSAAIKGMKLTVTDSTENIEVDLKDLDIADDEGVEDVAKKILAAANSAIEAWNAKNAETAGYKYGNARVVTGTGDGTVVAQAAGDGLKLLVDQLALTNTASNSSGTINSGIQNVTSYNSGASAKLANTVVDFNDVNAWTDGAKITIGDTTYTVALGADSKFKNASNVVDLTDMKAGDNTLKNVAAERLTAAAKDNKIFTVGHDGAGNTTLQQKSSVKDSTDMTTREKIASYLGVSTANADSLENAKPGNGLTLQIGDTADSYNQLKVDIKDMHAASLGIDGLSIADQDSAAAAMDKIKAAINMVSDVRGTLGATQNRLDHTINNLSVMTENIQDAESTIRDVDVAEEMMAYTKNNILIQSAQAMLAQANQVPQGVLQLLQ